MDKNKSKFEDISKILESWNLKEAVNNADEKIKQQKEITRSKGITNKSINDYVDYLKKINENINTALLRTGKQSNQSEESSSNPKKMKLQNPESN